MIRIHAATTLTNICEAVQRVPGNRKNAVENACASGWTTVIPSTDGVQVVA